MKSHPLQENFSCVCFYRSIDLRALKSKAMCSRTEEQHRMDSTDVGSAGSSM